MSKRVSSTITALLGVATFLGMPSVSLRLAHAEVVAPVTASPPATAAAPLTPARVYTPAQNNTIARRFFESAWNKGDFNSVASILAPDVVDHSLVPGEKEGPEKFRAIVGMFRAAMPDVRMTIQDEIYAKDKVVHRWLVQGTHSAAPLFGVPPTKKKLTLSGVTIVRLANGQFKERWTQLDQLGLMQQLGLVPTPPSDGAVMKPKTPVSGKGMLSIPPESNNAIAEKFFDTAWNKGDFDSVQALLSPNVVDHSTVPGQAEGPEKFKAIVGMFRAALPDVRMTIQDEIYARDKVVHRWQVQGTHTGAPLFGVPATKKTIILTGVTIVRLVGGRFVERWTQLDLLGLMQQLGLVPVAGNKTAALPATPLDSSAAPSGNNNEKKAAASLYMASNPAPQTAPHAIEERATEGGEAVAGQNAGVMQPEAKALNTNKTQAANVELVASAAPEQSQALNLLVLKSLKAPVGRLKAPDDDFWNRDYLTGNWGGKRDELHEKGLDFALTYFAEYYSNVSGGLRQGGEVQQVGIISLDLYSSPNGLLKGRPGEQIHLTTAYLGGESLRDTKVGSLNPIINSDAVDAFRLFELWYGRKFDNNTKEIRIGKILPYVQLAASRSAGVLENGSFNYPTFLGFGVGGSYLAAPFGVQLRLNPRPRFTIIAQVQDGYDDPSGGTDNRYGLKLNISSREGFEGTIEAAYRRNQQKTDTGLPGTFRLGTQFHTGRFNNKYFDKNGNSIALTGGTAQSIRGNYSGYFVAEQMLKREGDEPARRRQGLTGFVKGGILPSNINTVSWHAATGLHYEGLVPGRDQDVVAFGLSRSTISNSVRDFQRDRQIADPTVVVPDAETVAELQYDFQFTPWWVVKLDAQRIIHPGGSKAIRDATVFGISTRFAF